MNMTAIIIEDEILAVKHLRQILDETGGIRVVEELESISGAVEWFKENPQPDIIFMDIHLADGLAFEIFRHVNILCPVVFTTAYDEYALKAFKVNSIDYLLKPIEIDDVKNALQKLKNLTSAGSMQTALHNLINTFKNQTKYKTHFLLPVKGDKLIPVKADELACLYIDTGIVKALTFDNRILRFENNLEELAEMLNPDDFFRANRQYIISRKAVHDIDLWFNNRLSVNLKVPFSEKILISKARIGEFKAWFGA